MERDRSQKTNIMGAGQDGSPLAIEEFLKLKSDLRSSLEVIGDAKSRLKLELSKMYGIAERLANLTEFPHFLHLVNSQILYRSLNKNSEITIDDILGIQILSALKDYGLCLQLIKKYRSKIPDEISKSIRLQSIDMLYKFWPILGTIATKRTQRSLRKKLLRAFQRPKNNVQQNSINLFIEFFRMYLEQLPSEDKRLILLRLSGRLPQSTELANYLLSNGLISEEDGLYIQCTSILFS